MVVLLCPISKRNNSSQAGKSKVTNSELSISTVSIFCLFVQFTLCWRLKQPTGTSQPTVNIFLNAFGHLFFII